MHQRAQWCKNRHRWFTCGRRSFVLALEIREGCFFSLSICLSVGWSVGATRTTNASGILHIALRVKRATRDIAAPRHARTRDSSMPNLALAASSPLLSFLLGRCTSCCLFSSLTVRACTACKAKASSSWLTLSQCCTLKNFVMTGRYSKTRLALRGHTSFAYFNIVCTFRIMCISQRVLSTSCVFRIFLLYLSLHLVFSVLRSKKSRKKCKFVLHCRKKRNF